MENGMAGKQKKTIYPANSPEFATNNEPAISPVGHHEAGDPDDARAHTRGAHSVKESVASPRGSHPSLDPPGTGV